MQHKPATASSMANSMATRLAYYLRSGLAAYWCSFFILILIEFFMGGQLSRILSKENYATYVNVLNTLPFYNIMLNAGVAYGIVYIASYNSGSRYSLLRQALRIQSAWYLILVPVHLAVFYCFGNLYFQALLITMVIAYTYAYKLSLTSFYLATRSYGKAALSNTLQKFALLVVFAAIMYSPVLTQQLNTRFFPLYPAIELAIVVLYFIVFSKTNYRAFTSAKINYSRRLLRYGKYATVNNGLNVLYYTILALVIRHSAINVHLQIIMGLCILFFRYTVVAIAPVFSTLTPQLARIKNDLAQVQIMYKKYILFILIISLLTLAGCRLFFSFIILHFYAPSYHDLPAYFNSFCYLIPLLFVNSLHASTLSALGKIKFTALAEVVCTILLLLIFIFTVLSPFSDYNIIFYIVLAHLFVKFSFLAFGTYKTLRTR